MLRRRIIKFGISVLVVFVAIGLFLNYMKSNVEHYHLFEDRRELFEAVKDEIEHIDKSKLGYQSNPWGSLLYTRNQFHDEVRSNLRYKIKQIKSGSDLSKLRYDESEGDILIIFSFNWERVDGNTYHIVYCKSKDVVESYYRDKDVEYDLIKLDDDWYGTKIGDAYIFQ